MQPRWLLYLVALSTSLAALPVISTADTIFTDFAPGNGYIANTGWAVAGSSSPAGANTVTASAFTSAGNYNLIQVDVAVSWAGGTNGATLSLDSDSGGVPGSAIETWTLTNLAAFGTCCAVATAISVAGITLQSGVQYWLAAGPLDGTTWDAWNYNSTSTSGTLANQIDGGAWNVFPGLTLGAFDVLGTPITAPTPEPATLLLFAGGLAGVAGLRRR